MKQKLLNLVTPFHNARKEVMAVIVVAELLFFGFAWQALKPVLLPSPLEVGQALVAFLGDSDFYANIIASLALTLKAMLFSIVVACLISYAYVIPLARPIAKFLIKFRYLSMIGLLFVFMLLFKDGGTVKISVLMFGVIPFFASSLLAVIDRIRQNEFDMCQTLKYTRWQTMFELIIYGRAEATLEAIRLNFAMAWMLITMVESLSMSSGGVGVMLFKYNKYNQLAPIFALQIVIFLLGVGFDYSLSKLRYALFPHVKFTEIKK